MSAGHLRRLDRASGEFAARCRALQNGVSFGVPWPQGLHPTGQVFALQRGGQQLPLDVRELAYWPDGSLKWTAHSVSRCDGDGSCDCDCDSDGSCDCDCDGSHDYVVKRVDRLPASPGVVIVADPQLSVSSPAGLQLRFARPGSSHLFEELSLHGQPVCSGATLVASIGGAAYATLVQRIDVENATSNRALIKVSGVVTALPTQVHHLPFDVRIYMYAHAPSIRMVHSFVHDLDSADPMTSLGLQFAVPLRGAEPYNRHVRLGGANRGVLKEEVQGLSGLRFGPTLQDRRDQTAGQPVTLHPDKWTNTDLAVGLRCAPTWDTYRLSQLSPDGFRIAKRTSVGCSWVRAAAGTRADGTAYVGSAARGGLAVGLSDFWERYPTQLDLDHLTTDEATITAWLYSPLAEPLDTRPYHDGLGLDSHAQQLQALDVTYEDYEPGFVSANGIARTSQLFLRPYAATPSNHELAAFASLVRDPPRLVPTAACMHAAGVFHGCWAPDHRAEARTPTDDEAGIERNLDLLFRFYRGQVEQQRWYGFWDYGDVQHTYDALRHAWRYDIGGYAWDNSELSTDLWLWLYFLHTGRADVFKMAEAMTRHTSEVDVYHRGRFRGFGTRHGVQHFSDSSKQLRISNVLYRRIYYYLTGDERTGDLIAELHDCQNALLTLDAHRKVQDHGPVPPGWAMANIGLDCGPLAAAWLTAWEQRAAGWARARDRLVALLEGIAALPHGIGNNAVLLHPETGQIRPCPPPTPEYAIKHLSMLFGFPEVFTELLDYAKHEHPDTVRRFKAVWLAYCRAYNGGHDVQLQEFGFVFPEDATWRQSHSTLTGLAAVEQNSEALARAAWRQFFETDGYRRDHDWTVVQATAPDYFSTGEEAPWITTNEAARYGVSAIVNLANIGRFLQ